MNAARRAGEAALRNQEIAFSICMAGLAVLARDNPAYSPDLLWAFAALLAFNLGYHVALRTRGDDWVIPMISMAANSVLVTAVLWLSGGSESPFWPMYLIPVFTACLYLERLHVIFATAACASFLASLYLLAMEPDSPLRWAAVEYLIKLSVLGVSASVTAQYAFRERRARADLSKTRADLEALAAELERAERDRLESTGGMTRFMTGLVYDLNGRLAVIRGRAELLADALNAQGASGEDARSIADAARALGRLGSDLLRVLQRRGETEAAPCSVGPLITQVLTLVEHRLGPRRLDVDRTVPDALPEVRVGEPHLQQVLLELLEAAVEHARPGSRLSVSAARVEDEVQVRLRYEGADDAAPPSPMPQRRLLEGFGGGVEALGMGRSSEFVLRLPVAAGAERAR